MSHYHIRTMTRSELDFAVELAAREGWNPGLHDPESFYRADPQGFLVGLLDGQPIGCISAVSYAGVFGFVGLYIVRPEYRGRGYGIGLWRRALERLQGHIIGLDGVVEQQPNYRKSGFTLAHRNIRYQGAGFSGAPDRSELIALEKIGFADLLAYDRGFFPADRESFLKAWITQPDSRGVAYLGQEGIRGYGVIRRCRVGWKIGPLFADTPDIAEVLLRTLAGAAGEGVPVFLDVPEPNPAALDLANRYGMVKVFETARMYTGEIPFLPLDRLYGITSFELG
jgi:GNAT superfamily N-acetyltransferase